MSVYKKVIFPLVLINITLLTLFAGVYFFDRGLWDEYKERIFPSTYEKLIHKTDEYHAKIDHGYGPEEEIYRCGNNIKSIYKDSESAVPIVVYYDLSSEEEYSYDQENDVYRETRINMAFGGYLTFLPDHYNLRYETDKKPSRTSKINGKLAHLYKLKSIEYPDSKPEEIWISVETGLPLDIGNGDFIYKYLEVDCAEAKLPSEVTIVTHEEEVRSNLISELENYMRRGLTKDEMKEVFLLTGSTDEEFEEIYQAATKE